MNGPLRREPTRASHWSEVEPPPREWLVEGLIPAGCVTLISGDGGLGKGTLMLQLGLAAATGGDWLGRGVKAGPSIVIQAEDEDDEIGRRLRSIAGAQGIDLAHADALETISQDHLGEEIALFRQVDDHLAPTGLLQWIEGRIERTRPVLFVLDPLADFFAGDHNSRGEVTRFVRQLARLAARSGTAIVLIDHPSYAGMQSGRGTAGTTGWNFKVRSRLYLSLNRDGDLMLDHMKSNYGAKVNPTRLRFDRGRFVVLDDDDAGGLDQSPRHDPAEAVFLDLLREEIAQGRRLSDKPGANYAPTVLADRAAANGFSKKRLETVMLHLLRCGVLSVKIDGPPSKLRRGLTLARLPAPSNAPANAGMEGSNTPANTPANDIPTPSIPPANGLPTPFLPPPYNPPGAGSAPGIGMPGRSSTRRREARR